MDNPEQSKKPTHAAFHVRGSEERGFWNRIGSAWPHKDGLGFNIQIETVPLDGKIVLRVISENRKNLNPRKQ